MHESLLTTKDLKEWTGFKQVNAVASWLEANHIKFFIGKNGEPKTTLEAINDVLTTNEKKENIEFDL